jgi:hypothetical protein
VVLAEALTGVGECVGTTWRGYHGTTRTTETVSEFWLIT